MPKILEFYKLVCNLSWLIYGKRQKLRIWLEVLCSSFLSLGKINFISMYFEFCTSTNHLIHPPGRFGFFQLHKEYMKLLSPHLIWSALSMISHLVPFIWMVKKNFYMLTICILWVHLEVRTWLILSSMILELQERTINKSY